MQYNIPHEASLILNFFGGKTYFIFENEKEVDSFIDFIKEYDVRFSDDFSRKADLKSAAWCYANLCHRYQIEWMDTEEYFKKFDMYPVSYSIVEDFVNKYNESIKCLSKFFTNMSDFI